MNILNKIWNEDCVGEGVGMSRIDDKSVDLIITSPPYNLGKNHHTGNVNHNPYFDDLPEDVYQEQQLLFLNKCYRVLKDTGSLLYNHKNRIRKGVQISPYEWIFKSEFVIKQEIVWFNRSQNFDKIRFYPMTERVYWLAKSPKTKLVNTINHHDLFGTEEWKPVGVKDQTHTRSFPLKMVEDLISCFPDSQVILDPYAGSFTTAVACENLGKDWIVIEKDREYCKIGWKRIQENREKLSTANQIRKTA